MVETFVDAPIPKFCGQLGFKMDAEQAFYNNVQDYDTARYYTGAQCEKLGGKLGPNLHCIKSNEKGGETDFSVLCKGLNKKATSTPEECGSDGTVFTATEKQKLSPPGCKGKLCNQDVSILNKHLRSYTEEECATLGGAFSDSGYGLGICAENNGMNYNTSCASLNSNMLPSISSVTGAGSSWWSYFFGES